jgi:uncharacterized membrane protein YbhN (UPF0104 family)
VTVELGPAPPRPSDQQPEETGVDVGRIVRRIALFVAVAVVAVVAVATLPGVDEVRDRLASADPAWIVLAAVFELCSMLGFAAALAGAFERAVPWKPALDLGFAEQGANVLLPAGGTGGPALGTLMMRRAGVPAALAAERHVALFLVTSAVSFGALVVAGLLVGVGVLPSGRTGAVGSFVPAGVGLAVLGVAVLFGRTALPPQPVGAGRVRLTVWRVRRFVHGGVRTSLHLLRCRERLFIFGAIAYYAFDVAALGASFQAFGGGGPPVGVFVLAYTVGHAGALVPTPGGVGGTDGGLIGMFVVYHAPLSLATTAVLGYRVFQLGMPVVLGAVSLLRIRHRLGDDERREAVAARFSELRR